MNSPTPLHHAVLASLGWRRVLLTLSLATGVAVLISPIFATPLPVLIGRAALMGLLALVVFAFAEHWPRRLPRWWPRWALQVLLVVAAMLLTVLQLYMLPHPGQRGPFWESEPRLTGFLVFAVTSLVLGPLIALSAVVQQREAESRQQALAFELERSELQRRAADAQLRLLQAQVEPHFLFNTLANVRTLVDAGSPQASEVLGQLIAYLRAAVPRLQQTSTTLGQELELVRAYLALMQMRMPDRLQFKVQAEPETLALRCPPMTLLSLVENAVQHGIDPSETGGRIEVRVHLAEGLCHAEVVDTGLGLQAQGSAQTGLGTGLASLRERLRLGFGETARLEVQDLAPHGVRARLQFPAQRA